MDAQLSDDRAAGGRGGRTVRALAATGLVACAAVLAASGLVACGGGDEFAEAEALQAEEASVDGREQALAARAAHRAPTGFGAAVTGGAGGATVRVTTPAELQRELCRTRDAQGCTDDTPRIIEIASTIDLTDSEGEAATTGCVATDVCTGTTAKSEITLVVQDWQKSYCAGKPTARYTYKKAGVAGMLVGSNKTVVGVGSQAGIKGKGLELKGRNVANVIIRNLRITDINEGMVWGGDAITITNARKVWIDHNHIARVGRMFIVTGTGDHTGVADEVTISNNELDGRSPWSARCDGNHYWTMLLVGNGRLTLSGNYIHHFSGRGPRIDSGDAGATVHIVNNYYETGGWHAVDYAGAATRVLVEGNHFKDVPSPVVTDPSGEGQMFGFYRQTEATKAACRRALGRQCNPNVSVPRPAQDRMVQDSAVMNAVQPWAARIVKPYSAADVPQAVKASAGVGRI